MAAAVGTSAVDGTDAVPASHDDQCAIAGIQATFIMILRQQGKSPIEQLKIIHPTSKEDYDLRRRLILDAYREPMEINGDQNAAVTEYKNKVEVACLDAPSD